MPRVTLKEKGQLTIPATVREQIAASTGDVFEVVVVNGDIVLTPQDVMSRQKAKRAVRRKGVDISRWIGAGKGQFKTPEEAASFIHAERAQWD